MAVTENNQLGLRKFISGLENQEVGRLGLNARVETVGKIKLVAPTVSATTYGFWFNDTGSDIIVNKVTSLVSVPSSGASTVNVGVGVSAGDYNATLVSALDVNTSGLVVTAIDAVVPHLQYVTTEIATGSASSATVGNLYVHYVNV